MNLSGKSLSIEGGEGSGKSTLLKGLEVELKKLNVDTLFTREPGGVEVAEKIREVIFEYEMTSITEMLLFAAGRNIHLEQKVFPALRYGKFVVLDRFIDSSLVYQGIARGVGLENVWSVNQIATKGFLPTKTIVLDIEAEKGIERILNFRQNEINRIDKESLEFHKKIREGYLSLASSHKDRIVVLDASKNPEEVLGDAMEVLRGM